VSRRWTEADVPDQRGRVALVTGANSGLGFHTTRVLAARGARVLLGCRDTAKGAAAIERIRDDHPEVDLEVVALDLASLDAVERAATAVAAATDRLDLLINNAGVMAPPRRETVDGFELQIGTNHLGHFALTGRLLPRLLATPDARVVTVSSLAHHHGRIDLDDLHREHGYQRWEAYGQSKLANLSFTFELQRRLAATLTETIAVAAHPGYADTNLQTNAPTIGRLGFLVAPVMRIGNLLLAQSDAQGALPQLYAATSDEVVGGDYIGPDGFREARGHPTRVRARRAAYDRELAAALWRRSEEETGVRYTVLDAAP
jgi:NAD(P)-dependent dehydrogenase (short-subunit alcohol dehydrogenase family)